MGLINAPRFTITNTPTVLNNDAYDANDVIFDRTALQHSMFTTHGGPFLLEQIEFWDSNDQTAAILTIAFLKANVTFGTADSGISISDSDALNLVGIYAAAAAGQTDLGGIKYGLWNPNIIIPEAIPSTATPLGLGTLYYAVASAGTPTYLTGCLQFRFTFSCA